MASAYDKIKQDIQTYADQVVAVNNKYGPLEAALFIRTVNEIGSGVMKEIATAIGDEDFQKLLGFVSNVPSPITQIEGKGPEYN